MLFRPIDSLEVAFQAFLLAKYICVFNTQLVIFCFSILLYFFIPFDIFLKELAKTFVVFR